MMSGLWVMSDASRMIGYGESGSVLWMCDSKNVYKDFWKRRVIMRGNSGRSRSGSEGRMDLVFESQYTRKNEGKARAGCRIRKVGLKVVRKVSERIVSLMIPDISSTWF